MQTILGMEGEARSESWISQYKYKGVNPANEFHIRPDDVSMGDDVPELLRGLALGAAGELGF